MIYELIIVDSVSNKAAILPVKMYITRAEYAQNFNPTQDS